VAAAASFAFAMKHFAKDFARQVYREAAPKVNLCHAPSAGEPHREVCPLLSSPRVVTIVINCAILTACTARGIALAMGPGASPSTKGFGFEAGGTAVRSLASGNSSARMCPDLDQGGRTQFFKGQSAHCVHEWPSWENGALRIGAVLNEAAHTCFLNLMVAILCPYAGKYFYFVVAAMVVTTLRSPYCFTGPGLNMVPSMMGAALYGGLENLRVHLFGTFLGMLTAAQIERRTGIIKSGFAAALSWRPGATKEIVEADLSWAESRRKAPARGKAKSKEA
jgi:hypothetical protein